MGGASDPESRLLYHKQNAELIHTSFHCSGSNYPVHRNSMQKTSDESRSNAIVVNRRADGAVAMGLSANTRNERSLD